MMASESVALLAAPETSWYQGEPEGNRLDRISPPLPPVLAPPPELPPPVVPALAEEEWVPVVAPPLELADPWVPEEPEEPEPAAWLPPPVVLLEVLEAALLPEQAEAAKTSRAESKARDCMGPPDWKGREYPGRPAKWSGVRGHATDACPPCRKIGSSWS
jgi:hypothetical protein